jgi:hypothetical protein
MTVTGNEQGPTTSTAKGRTLSLGAQGITFSLSFVNEIKKNGALFSG